MAAATNRRIDSRRAAGIYTRPTVPEITRSLTILGVDISVSEKDLKKKYIELVRIHHPDRGGDQEKMKDLTTSYDLLTGLSEAEKKEYQTQMRAGYRTPSSFRGNSGASPEGFGNRAHHNQRAYDFAEAYRQAQQQQKPFHYRYRPEENERRAAGMEHLFRTGPMSGVLNRIQHTPLYVIMMRALIVYLIVTSVLVLIYRSYADNMQEQGWRGLHSAARFERMEDLFKQRQEQLERLRDAERRSLVARKEDLERAKERRAMEYVDRRTHELRRLEASCWPVLEKDGSQGVLLKDPKDPVGITYFEPQQPSSSGAASATAASSSEVSSSSDAAGAAGNKTTSPPPPPSSTTVSSASERRIAEALSKPGGGGGGTSGSTLRGGPLGGGASDGNTPAASHHSSLAAVATQPTPAGSVPVATVPIAGSPPPAASEPYFVVGSPDVTTGQPHQSAAAAAAAGGSNGASPLPLAALSSLRDAHAIMRQSMGVK